MIVAVTGAGGFTGRHVLAALCRKGMEGVALAADLNDPAAIERAVEAQPFDALIHLAAIAFIQSDDWRSFYTVNQLGSMALAAAVARHRPGIRCLVASSAQVYGAGLSGLIDERQPLNPGNHYAASKAFMEAGLAMWRDDLDIVIARPFNYTGVGQQDRYVVPKLVKHFRERAEVIELGNIDVRRDFGDVRSVANAYVDLVSVPAPPPIVNIAAGELYAIRDLYDLLRDMTGHAPEVRINPAFVRANDVPELGGDAALLRATLPDWRPRPLRDLLEWMLRPAATDEAVR
jgi:GDP-6-deoxy-D-talose 4-dehydrogenase